MPAKVVTTSFARICPYILKYATEVTRRYAFMTLSMCAPVLWLDDLLSVGLLCNLRVGCQRWHIRFLSFSCRFSRLHPRLSTPICTYSRLLPLTLAHADAKILTVEWQKPHILARKLIRPAPKIFSRCKKQISKHEMAIDVGDTTLLTEIQRANQTLSLQSQRTQLQLC